jgi:hypothetical protein
MYFFPSHPVTGGMGEWRVEDPRELFVMWWSMCVECGSLIFVYLMLLVFGNKFKIDPPFVYIIPNSLAGYIKLNMQHVCVRYSAISKCRLINCPTENFVWIFLFFYACCVPYVSHFL